MLPAFVFWSIGIGFIVVQTTLLPVLPQWLGRPDFLFILVAFIAYRFPWIPGIMLVFSLGWVMDVVAAIHLGFYPLLSLLTFATLKALAGKSRIRESTYQIPLVGVSYFLVQICFYFVYSLAMPDALPEWSWGQTLQRTVLMVVVAIPLFVLFNRLLENLRQRRAKAKSHRRRSVKVN